MKFRFRLEKILGLSKLKETQLKQRLAAQLKKLEDLRNQYAQAEIHLRNVIAKQAEDCWRWGELGGELVTSILGHLDALTEQMRAQLDEVQAARNDLVNAVKKRRALETVKEKRRKEFQKKESKREQLQLEELYRNGQMER